MKIAFDAQLLFEQQKTGIGWTAEYILRNIIKEMKNEYYLNYFSMWRGKEKKTIIKEYQDLGYRINKCSYFLNAVYKKSWNTIPISYSLFFGGNADVTQFFNYDVPPGVKGKAVTFVYDMVYKAFPETIEKKTYEMLDYNLLKACERADHIITISQFSKNEIIKYIDIPEEKISIMPCGVDLSLYHPNYSEEELKMAKEKYGINSDYILYLGTLEPRKNIERLIEAYALLKGSMDYLPKLVLAGKKGWMYDTIFKSITSYNLTENVIFTDYVDSADVPKLLKGAQVFVFPSLYEGFGMPPLEAMACGTPVIVSNSASLPEVVEDAGYLVNPYSTEEIKNGMELIISDKSLAKKLSDKGLQQAKKFTWKKSVQKIIEIYESMI